MTHTAIEWLSLMRDWAMLLERQRRALKPGTPEYRAIVREQAVVLGDIDELTERPQCACGKSIEQWVGRYMCPCGGS